MTRDHGEKKMGSGLLPRLTGSQLKDGKTIGGKKQQQHINPQTKHISSLPTPKS